MPQNLVRWLAASCLVALGTETLVVKGFTLPYTRVVESPRTRMADAFQETKPMNKGQIMRMGFDENGNWDGDDLRPLSKFRRRMKRSMDYQTGGGEQPAKNALILLTTLAFVYQVFNTVKWISRRFPDAWPSKALFIIWDAMMGTARPGPFTRNYLFTAYRARREPFRYLTSGFLHGGILQLIFSLYAWRRQPAWLETGLGSSLYLTTYLLSIVTGNLGHVYFGTEDTSAVCMTAMGGISGIYGIMFASLAKMGNERTLSSMIRPFVIMILYAVLLPSTSFACHMGGFLGGVVVGLLFGPNYSKSYAMRRKGSLEADIVPKDYRFAMGFGIKPSSRGLIPLPLLWIAIIGLLIAYPPNRAMPARIWRGITRPGSFY